MFLANRGTRGGDLFGVGSEAPIWRTYCPGLRNGWQVASSSSHDGFKALQGEIGDYRASIAASSSSGVSSKWWGILSTTLQRTVATNILDHSSLGNMPSPGPETPLSDLLKIAMKLPEVSRLPLRDD